MSYRIKTIAIISGILLVAFMASHGLAAKVKVEKKTIEKVYMEEDYMKTADNFIVLFDASGSKGQKYKNTGSTKVELSKQVLRDQAEALPDLGFNAGIYLYTPWKVIYPMTRYSKEDFLKAVDSLPSEVGQEPTPLGEGIEALDPILAKLSGRTTVFIFSDGQYSLKPSLIPGARAEEMVGDPVAAAKSIINKYSNVCFYIISTATTPKDEETLSKMAAVNECSRVVPLEQAASLAGCTAAAICTIKATRRVDTETLTKIVGMEIKDVLFDFDKSDVLSQFYAELNALGKFLSGHSEAYVILTGYADSVGTGEYNMGLSRRRAESVAAYLKENFNIGYDRIFLSWYGEANPVASNDTPYGRAKNRRVEISVAGLG